MPSKKRVDRRWIRGPADELAIENGCYFDEEAGEKVCEFIETFCRQSKGKWAGELIKLLDWQRDFLMRLFGWKRADGRRRFRTAYLEVPKKNGKSTMLSALILVLLLIDGEAAPEIYLNACDTDQAAIIFEEAKRMVEASEELKARLEIIDSKKRIVHPAGNGVIKTNSSIAASKDGLNPSGIIFDELHRQPNRLLWEVFEFAGASREQPLTVSITTAGEDTEGPWHEQRELSEKINAGIIPDTTHLGVVYRAMEEDDLDDPAVWKRCNPSLGVTIREEDFVHDHAKAKRTPADWANFRRLRLNLVTREEARFITPEAWAACDGKPRSLSGRSFFGGLDLSSTTALSAFAAIAGDSEEGYDLHVRFWLPEDNIVDLERQHGVPYRAWANAGLIELTPGSVIDYGFIRRAVNDLADEGELRKLLVDPYNATKLALELRESDGLEVEFIRQGFLPLSAPTKELERLILGRKIRHGGHPILRWMVSNAVAVRDEAGSVKLSKKKARKPIDGMAAAVNAVAAMGTQAEDDGDSVYETRGLLFL